MSDRTTLVPERALLDTINDLRRRVEIMERRQRWQGAIRAERITGSIDPPASAASGTPQASITFDLDQAGTWLFLAPFHLVYNAGAGGAVCDCWLEVLVNGMTWIPGPGQEFTEQFLTIGMSGTGNVYEYPTLVTKVPRPPGTTASVRMGLEAHSQLAGANLVNYSMTLLQIPM